MRLDNSNEAILALIRVFNETGKANDIRYDPKDPGATPPVDVCVSCMADYFRLEEELADRPSYDDGEYYCIMCGKRLVEEVDK